MDALSVPRLAGGLLSVSMPVATDVVGQKLKASQYLMLGVKGTCPAFLNILSLPMGSGPTESWLSVSILAVLPGFLCWNMLMVGV